MRRYYPISRLGTYSFNLKSFCSEVTLLDLTSLQTRYLYTKTMLEEERKKGKTGLPRNT